jgi:hypothetical protein
MYIRGFNSLLLFSFSFFFTQCLVPDSAPALLTTPSPPWGNALHASPSFSFFCLLHQEAPNQRPSTQLRELPCLTQSNAMASLISHNKPPPAPNTQCDAIWWQHFFLFLEALWISSATPIRLTITEYEPVSTHHYPFHSDVVATPLFLHSLSRSSGYIPSYHHTF